MKRLVIFSSLLLMVVGLMAFDCSSSPQMTSAKMALNRKNYDEAKKFLLEEINKNPKSDEAYYLLGTINAEQDEAAEMMSNFNKSLEISPKFKADIESTKLFVWAASFNDGVKAFNSSTKETDPDKMTAGYEKAIKEFERAVLIQPDSLITYQSLAFSYINAGRKLDAVKPLTVLIEKQNSEDSYVRLGDIYYNSGVKYTNAFNASGDAKDSLKADEYYNKSIDLLEKAKEFYPNNKDILVYLSNAYIATNQLDVAREAFRTGIEKDPTNKYYRYNYGYLLLEIEKFEEAIEQFKSAIEIDPEYASAIYNLSISYVKWGAKLREEAEKAESGDKLYLEKFNSALESVQKYFLYEEANANAYDLLGTIYANLGENEKSLEAYNKADSLR